MSSTPMPSAPRSTKQAGRLRGWQITLSLFGFVILSIAGVFGYLHWTFTQDWDAAIAETDRLEPRWRLADIEADREQVPDNENSALFIIAMTKDVPNTQVGDARFYPNIFEELTPLAELNEQQVQFLRRELAKVAEPLKKARQLKDMPRGRFPIVYSDDYISTLVREQQNARGPANWLMHDAFLLSQERNYDQAFESCRGIVNVGRSLGDEPLMISALIRMATHAITMETLERVLAQGEASDEQLRLMLELLSQETKNVHFQQGLRGERAGYQLLFECIRAGSVHFGEMANTKKDPGGSFSITEWFVDTQVVRYYPEFLRHMNRGVEVVKLPIHERDSALTEWDADSRASTNIVTRLLTPALIKIHQADCRSQGMLRATVAGLACERYRLRHKVWPASLDVLVKEKLLDAVPADPMNNQPIRYRWTKDGIVVYSIGIDRQDDQGIIDRKRPQEPGVDVGFRLWDVPARRQPALPPVELPQGD